MKYLIIKADPLSDQYETDADRRPICITDDITVWQAYGYEIFEILPNGELHIIQNYEDYDPVREEEDEEEEELTEEDRQQIKLFLDHLFKRED